jgi:hypothetical protein
MRAATGLHPDQARWKALLGTTSALWIARSAKRVQPEREAERN